IAFGLGTDIPTPADYDGDGKTDISFFRQSNGTWYLQQSTSGFTGVQFGAAADIPVPNAFVP
ncbi:MAG: VCBS repeat-containing protein, partial [Pyrinomonadaceae bacterium]